MKISEIELLELGEALKGHEACIEKAGVMTGQCEDNDVRHLVERTQRMLQQHYEEMLRLVNEATVAESYARETRRPTAGGPPQGYTTPGWSGPSYETGYGGTGKERNEGSTYFGNVKT